MALLHFTRKYKMNEQEANIALKNVLETYSETSDEPVSSTMTVSVNPSKGITTLLFVTIIAIVFTLFMPLYFALSSHKTNQNSTKPDISVLDYQVEDNTLYLTLDGSFIDYSSIYAITESGEKVTPSDFKPFSGLITFNYDQTEWNIYVSDMNDRILHMLLTPPQ